MYRVLIKLLSFRKSLRLICYICDIDGVRDGDLNVQAAETRFYRLSDQFIVHNASMEKWLKATLHDADTAVIDFFDFLAQPSSERKELSFDIAFAGNLSKSPFLEHMETVLRQSPKLRFHLFGEATVRMKDQKNIEWHGVFEPGSLPGKLPASFGLVWDGDSTEGLKGLAGQYLVYNSPHKLSLYILSGLPLIVPAGSASAELVRKYKIGVVVNDLSSIQNEIERISIDEYHQMQKNMSPLAKQISRGQRLIAALAELDEKAS
ncbi:hypothetical protein LZZ85_10790 [Terrimonas sp. NA20]|uniref:Beta-1,6-galactofuranosyltransferase n=1 Tax=Terrimonas ginsenosidimutans TaxID=2908004 RepID=A0ABS9KR11_9BACT|nr:hypothetical protein [Terrimonas ginsenosidimutans]MCG2614772.1 hypothetical protein [Terrimonas ginsenosidimutans]